MTQKEIELLDMFAAHALQGILARNAVPRNGMTIEQTAWKIAHAMLEERKKLVKEVESKVEDPYHYKVIFKPAAIIPDLEIK